MRSTSDILRSIRLGLQNSRLKDFAYGGNLWALLRAISNTIAEQDLALNRLRDSLFTSLASDQDLDRAALRQGYLRKPAAQAAGYALVKSLNGSTLSRGTLFATADRAIVVETTQDYRLGSTEVPIPIRAVAPGYRSNLLPGTVLFNAGLPSLSLVVGRYRDPISGLPMEGLRGGMDLETDDELRARLTNLASRNSRDRLAAQIVSQVPALRRLSIQESSTGYIQVYVDTNEREVLAQVTAAIEQFKPVGVAYSLLVLRRLPLNVSLQLVVNAIPSNFNQLVRALVQNYFDSLQPGDSFRPYTLKQLLEQSLVQQATVLTPLEAVSARAEELITLGELSLRTDYR